MLDFPLRLRRNRAMFPPRRVLAALALVLAAPASLPAAATTTGAAAPAFHTAAPVLTGGALLAAVLAAALLAQMLYLLRRGGVVPTALVERIAHSIQSGNYQEAWEACHRRSDTALGRMMQPTLERLGLGRDDVEARLAEEQRRELRRFQLQLAALAVLALAAIILCLATASADVSAAAGAAFSSSAPRAATLAWGNAALLAALAVAVAAPVAVTLPLLLRKADSLLDEAREQGLQLVSGLPYEDIEGVRIGRDFHAGSLLGDPALAQTGRLQVSMELTTKCPTCNGPINFTRDSCPHCGQLLSWS